MMFGMLVAGVGLVLAGLLAIGYGIQIKEFSVGNTLILAGVIGVCTGAIMLGLGMAVRELQNIARRLGAGLPGRAARCFRRARALPAPGDGSFPYRDQEAAEQCRQHRARRRAPPPPWHG